MGFSLRALQGTARWLVTWFLIVVGVGYLTGIVFVRHTTHNTPTGIVHQFRGNEDVPLEQVQEIKYPKSPYEMLNIIHAHVTSFALIFMAVGGLFLGTSVSERWKAILALEPFAATLLLFGGMAAVRFLPEGWELPAAWVMLVAGASTFVCLYAMIGRMLWEMWHPRNRRVVA